MIFTRRLLIYIISLLLMTVVSACGGGGGGGSSPPPAGTLKLTIVDAESATEPLSGVFGASVLLLDEAGDPIATYSSDADGVVMQADLTPGSYQIKVSAQGFNPSPAPRVPPFPVVVVDDQTTTVTIELFPLASTTLGAISGTISDTGGNPVAGALVIAAVGDEEYTSISADDGSYILYNVAEGAADVTALIQGLNFPTLSAVAVIATATTPDQDVAAESEATASISGTLQPVAVGSLSASADVTLIDRVTREVIPGMRVFTDDADAYTMSGLPDGNFEIIASLLNDGIVIDPDESVTQGDPLVTVSAGVVSPGDVIDFKVTGAVEVDNPPTPVDNVIPEFSLAAGVVFEWHSASSYSSLKAYAIEVVNESGDTVWGGFDGSGLPVTGSPLVEVAKASNITLAYNDDGNGAPLEVGRYYQIRIYALDDVTTVSADYPQGYKLLSVTENLNGIFKVVE